MSRELREFAPPIELVDYLHACGLDVFRRWDKVPDGIVYSGCICGYHGTPGTEPVTTLRPLKSRLWMGIDVGTFKIGLCPNCGALKWCRIPGNAKQPPPKLTDAVASFGYGVAHRLRGLLGDMHGRIRRNE
jgi:hypothetical protein